LATTIGPRNLVHYKALCQSADWIEAQFKAYGYKPTRQRFRAKPLASRMRGYEKANSKAQAYANVIAELRGKTKPKEINVIGAHYDSVPVPGCRAANDNASGVAAVLSLAKHFAQTPQSRTIRFVAFTNEEPPFSNTKGMGSLVYAKACQARRENILAMFTPETIGYYSEKPQSQHYPPLLGALLPDRGNFISFVGQDKSRALITRAVNTFRTLGRIPVAGASLPITISDVSRSDHSSFWDIGVPAFMVTDTANFRYPHYHTHRDNPEHLDYARMARVVAGLIEVTKDLANH
jgi:Zn-dependent M28 family amino/carboxypeptidase